MKNPYEVRREDFTPDREQALEDKVAKLEKELFDALWKLDNSLASEKKKEEQLEDQKKLLNLSQLREARLNNIIASNYHCISRDTGISTPRYKLLAEKVVAMHKKYKNLYRYYNPIDAAHLEIDDEFEVIGSIIESGKHKEWRREILGEFK